MRRLPDEITYDDGRHPQMDFARHVANRVVFMDAGVIVEQADAEFLHQPAAARTRSSCRITNKEVYLMNRKRSPPWP